MADFPLTLVVGGKEYAEFSSANVTTRLDALTNTFGFGATAEDAAPLPFEGGEACDVFVEGEQVLSGYIELVNPSGDEGSHKIDIQGRDRTGDLLDSTIGVFGELTGTVALPTVIQRVMDHIGLKGVGVVVEEGVTLKPFVAAEDIHTPEVGQNAFEWIEKLARKRQVLLTSDANGNLVISRGMGNAVEAWVQNRVEVARNSNNVKSYSASYDTTGRFNTYQSLGQLNAAAGSLAQALGGLDSLVGQGENQIFTDEAIREGRQMILVSESTNSSAENAERAKWEQRVREARGSVYSCKVAGYLNQEFELWRVNTVVLVQDDFAGIQRQMLVNGVRYSLSLDEGSTTLLSFVERNAYQVQLEEPSKTEVKAKGLFSGS